MQLRGLWRRGRWRSEVLVEGTADGFVVELAWRLGWAADLGALIAAAIDLPGGLMPVAGGESPAGGGSEWSDDGGSEDSDVSLPEAAEDEAALLEHALTAGGSRRCATLAHPVADALIGAGEGCADHLFLLRLAVLANGISGKDGPLVRGVLPALVAILNDPSTGPEAATLAAVAVGNAMSTTKARREHYLDVAPALAGALASAIGKGRSRDEWETKVVVAGAGIVGIRPMFACLTDRRDCPLPLPLSPLVRQSHTRQHRGQSSPPSLRLGVCWRPSRLRSRLATRSWGRPSTVSSSRRGCLIFFWFWIVIFLF